MHSSSCHDTAHDWFTGLSAPPTGRKVPHFLSSRLLAQTHKTCIFVSVAMKAAARWLSARTIERHRPISVDQLLAAVVHQANVRPATLAAPVQWERSIHTIPRRPIAVEGGGCSRCRQSQWAAAHLTEMSSSATAKPLVLIGNLSPPRGRNPCRSFGERQHKSGRYLLSERQTAAPTCDDHTPLPTRSLCIHGEQSKHRQSSGSVPQERGEREKEADTSKILHLSGPMFSRAGIMRV